MMEASLRIYIHRDGDLMGISKELLSIKAVLFDLDGTLVDSMWMWKEIDIEYLARYGWEYPEDLQQSIEGMSFDETARYFKKRFNIPDSIEEISKCWNEMAYEKYAHVVDLKPGAYEFLDYLKSKDIKMGVSTSNSRILAEAVLNNRKVKDYFGAILTGDECGHGKPEPDVFLNTAKALGISNTKCLVFEDIPAGIIAGKRAGMKTVAVKDEFSDHLWDRKSELSDYQISDYWEIMNEIHNS